MGTDKCQKGEKTKQRQNENSTLCCSNICCSCPVTKSFNNTNKFFNKSTNNCIKGNLYNKSTNNSIKGNLYNKSTNNCIKSNLYNKSTNNYIKGNLYNKSTNNCIKGNLYNKGTNNSIKGNIYNRIKQTANQQQPLEHLHMEQLQFLFYLPVLWLSSQLN